MSAIRGINVAAVTPRREGPEIDLGATFELIEYLAGAGVAGIALLGTTGEFLHYDLSERVRLLALGVKRSRVPIIAGVGHSSLDGALALAREAADAGAAAVLLMPPYFFRYSQEEVKAFYLHFAEEFKGALDTLLYNIPFFTTPLACDSALELLATGLFAGIKDSSGDFASFERLQAARAARPFNLLVGNDVIFSRARAAGADGVVSGVACAAPELMLGLDRAIGAGASLQIERLETRLKEFIARIDRFPVPVGIREALEVRGLKVGPRSVPLGPQAQREVEAFREWFQSWLPTVQEEAR
ncbi:MAG: dihydrodipicolinate synthase family protein [Acidobacteria bacterium]|nr:dihydrodipicolinate synthase family protein [Acidobacteriota bacterium]